MVQAERLEAHWVACMASLGGGARVTRIPGGTVVAHARLSRSIMNFMTLRSSEPVELASSLELGSAILAGFGRPPALFLAPPAGNVAELAERLRALGWREAVRQVVLVRALSELPAATPDHLYVARVGADGISAWGDLLMRAYEVEPGLGAQIKTGWTHLDGQVGYYQAMLNGQPVGTGLTWQQDDLGGLYCGALLPEFRRRGIAQALLLHRMHDLAAAGAHWAYLQTEADSPMAHLAQAQLRFQVAYERALWIPV